MVVESSLVFLRPGNGLKKKWYTHCLDQWGRGGAAVSSQDRRPGLPGLNPGRAASAIPFTPHCLCLSVEILQAIDPLYPVPMTGGKCITCRGLHNSEINHSCVSPRICCLEYTYLSHKIRDMDTDICNEGCKNKKVQVVWTCQQTRNRPKISCREVWWGQGRMGERILAQQYHRVDQYRQLLIDVRVNGENMTESSLVLLRPDNRKKRELYSYGCAIDFSGRSMCF